MLRLTVALIVALLPAIAYSAPDPRFSLTEQVLACGNAAEIATSGITYWSSYYQPETTCSTRGAQIGYLRTPGVLSGFGPTLSDLQVVLDLAEEGCLTSYQIGGEPTNQDEISPTQFAAAYNAYAADIRSVCPNAVIFAPNLLNMAFSNSFPTDLNQDQVWSGTSADWLAQLLAAYPAMYGIPFDADGFAMHGYDLSGHAPTTNVSGIESDLFTLRQLIDSTPGEAGKPIMLSEFGVINEAGDASGGADFLTAIGQFVQSDGPSLKLIRALPFIDCRNPGGLQLFTDCSGHTLTAAGVAWSGFARSGAPYTIRDVSQLRATYGEYTSCAALGTKPCADYDGDGKIDIQDFSLARKWFE